LSLAKEPDFDRYRKAFNAESAGFAEKWLGSLGVLGVKCLLLNLKVCG